MDPTNPVQVHFFPALLVQLAVAVAPGFRHVIAAKLGAMKRIANKCATRNEYVIALQEESD